MLLKPNKIETAQDLRMRRALDLILNGNSYLHVVGSPKMPLEIEPLYAFMCEAIPRSYADLNTIKYYFDYSKGFSRDIDPEEVIHVLNTNHRNRIKGVSWLVAGAKKFSLVEDIENYQQRIYQNGIFPQLHIMLKDEFKDVIALDEFRETLLKRLQGTDKTGLPLITGNAVNSNVLDFSPADMQVIENEKVTASMIATMMNVPAELLGTLIDKVNVASYKEAMRQIYQQTIIPLIETLLMNDNAFFFPEGNLIFKLNQSRIDVLKDTTQDLKEATWLTLNEKRRRQGLEPLDDKNADLIFLPGNVVTLEEAAFSGDTGAE
jgi:HK97 family phage portal protein